MTDWLMSADRTKILNLRYIAMLGIHPENPTQVVAVHAGNNTNSIVFVGQTKEDCIEYIRTLVQDMQM